jgi:hypothetical protein
MGRHSAVSATALDASAVADTSAVASSAESSSPPQAATVRAIAVTIGIVRLMLRFMVTVAFSCPFRRRTLRVGLQG